MTWIARRTPFREFDAMERRLRRALQDIGLVEAMGNIYERTQEHLGRSDTMIGLIAFGTTHQTEPVGGSCAAPGIPLTGTVSIDLSNAIWLFSNVRADITKLCPSAATS